MIPGMYPYYGVPYPYGMHNPYSMPFPFFPYINPYSNNKSPSYGALGGTGNEGAEAHP